jgi:hypothetical protein
MNLFQTKCSLQKRYDKLAHITDTIYVTLMNDQLRPINEDDEPETADRQPGAASSQTSRGGAAQEYQPNAYPVRPPMYS